MTLVTYMLAFLLAISLLVAVHEYGHYLVARLCGIKVLRFSIGFGKPIWRRRWGRDQTEYCVSALPLGGYVKMLDEREGDVAEDELHRSFQAQPVWQRVAVLLAGPLFNFLFVIVAFWLLFLIGIRVEQAIVGQVTADSPAASAGLAPGDEVVSVAGRSVDGWENAFVAVIEDMVGDGEITLGVVSAGADATREIRLQVPQETARLEEPGMVLAALGFMPGASATIVSVGADGAGARAGLAAGDRIVAVDDQPIRSFFELQLVMSALDEVRPLNVRYARDGREFDTVVTPEAIEGQPGLFLNITGARNVSVRRLGPLEALPAALERCVSQTAFTLRMLGHMVTGDVSAKNLSGPISIAQFAGEAAQRGLSYYVGFLAVISISLGILNLLPVPMLDGGQIVYQLIEGVTGQPLSERVQLIGQQFGIFVLLSVMFFAFYNDLSRLFGA